MADSISAQQIGYAIDSTTLSGWASRLFLPPPVISSFVPFVSLWAVADNFLLSKAAQDAGDKKPIEIQTAVTLDNGKLKPDNLTDQDNFVKLTAIPATILNSGETNIDGVDINLIPILSNVSQLITSNFRGGIGLVSFSVTNTAQIPLLYKANAVLEINNPFDLQDISLTVTRLLVPGGLYFAVAGWQCNTDRKLDMNYKDISQNKVDLVLPPKFDEVPGEFFSTDSNNNIHMYIDLNDTHYGYIQCFLMRLQEASFRTEHSKLIADLVFVNPASYFADKIRFINVQTKFRDLLHGTGDTPGKPLKYMTIEDNKSNNRSQIVAYRLSDVINSYETVFNTEANVRNQTGSTDTNTSGTIINSQLRIGTDEEINESLGKQLVTSIGSYYYDQASLQGNTLSQLNEMADRSFTLHWYKPATQNETDKSQNKQPDLTDVTNNPAEIIKTIGDLPVRTKLLEGLIESLQNIPLRQALDTLIKSVSKDLGLNLLLMSNLTYEGLSKSDATSPLYSDQVSISKADSLKQVNDQGSTPGTKNGSKYDYFISCPDNKLREYVYKFNPIIKNLLTVDSSNAAEQIINRSLTFGSYLQHMILEFGSYNSLIRELTTSKSSAPSAFYARFIRAYAANLQESISTADNSKDNTKNNIGDDANQNLPELASIINAIKNAQNSPDIGTPENQVKMYNAALDAILAKRKEAGNDPSKQKQVNELKKQLRSIIASGPWGFTTRMFFANINATIHGTFGLYIMSVLYFYGILNALSGFYGLTSITHNFSPGKFETQFRAYYIQSPEELQLIQKLIGDLDESGESTVTPPVLTSTPANPDASKDHTKIDNNRTGGK